jgi:hypothetical protein
MSQQELLKKVIQALHQAGIQYMITGSVVSSLQGEPRATHDIDIVVTIQRPQVRKLVELFPPPDFHLDEESVSDAIGKQGMFNLIAVSEGYKIDFWMLTDDPFDQSRFSRKYTEEFLGLRVQVSRPEDTILAKLRWATLSGGSEKHFTDALRVYEVQHGELDSDYLERWATKLGVESLWKHLTDEAKSI